MNRMKSLLGLYALMLLGGADDYFSGERRTIIPEKEESREDRERREKCGQAAIEAARLKRERKAAKMKKDFEKNNKK